jgi:hypothetical protein
MILWFLRLFLAFRQLEFDLAAARNACAAEAEERERSEQRLDVLTRDRDKLWELVAEAQKGERYALQSQANVLSQRSGGGVPYPDAHQIDNPAIDQKGGPIGPASRILPSQRAEWARQAAIEEIVKRDIAPMFHVEHT